MQERIQKLISAAGLMSRRAAEKALSDGRVTVNGNLASLGDKADVDIDDISIEELETKLFSSKPYKNRTLLFL